MSVFKKLKFKITGATSLLMHSDKFANPLDPLTKKHKELTGKRKKTDEDHEAIALSEWRGALYWDDKEGVYIPGENIEACLLGAAKLQRLGTTFKRGLMVLESICKLDYKGTKSLPKMMENLHDYSYAKSVVVQRARIMRVRPMFSDWSTEFTVGYNDEVVNEGDIIKAVHDAGEMIGLCDWRPRFGRFDVELLPS